MNRTRRTWLPSILGATALCLLTVAVGVAQAGGATNPSEAVQMLVQPFAMPGPPAAGCNALTGQVADCPVTAGLRARLQSPTPGVETGNLVSRSQNPPATLEVAQVKLPEGATEAQVNTRWRYGSGPAQSETIITFVVRKEAGGWLVDDSYCQNNLSTSIYNAPVGPCPTTVVNEVPGMPTTGAGSGENNLLLLVLAGITLVLGGLLRQQGRRRAG